MSGANLKVRVIRATGHGPHGLLPKESAFCVIEIPGGTPTSAVTKEGHMEKAAVCWDEELQFQLSSDSKDVKVALLGQLPTNAGDLIGHGSCNLTGLFGGLKDAHHQEVSIPLSMNGRQAGEMQLSLEYTT